MRRSQFAVTLISTFLLGSAIASPAGAIDWSWASLSGKPAPQDALVSDHICEPTCTVAGAEVDDAATVAARKLTGTGPAAGLASDRRLKTGIRQVGTLENGVKVYAFKFIWDDTVRVGVIAQDLLERPDSRAAVLTLANGLLGVDYAALGLRMATHKQWLDSGLEALKADYKPPFVRSAKLDEPIKLYNRPH